jgi:hypothetical protein
MKMAEVNSYQSTRHYNPENGHLLHFICFLKQLNGFVGYNTFSSHCIQDLPTDN